MARFPFFLDLAAGYMLGLAKLWLNFHFGLSRLSRAVPVSISESIKIDSVARNSCVY